MQEIKKYKLIPKITDYTKTKYKKKLNFFS